jgi:phospholipid/cholesterol/gamma-HCH transport system ATP-binding protein
MQRALSITSIVVTHDMGTAFMVSTRMAMVHKGRIVAEGTPDNFRTSTNPLVRNFIEGNAPEDEDMAALVGTKGP